METSTATFSTAEFHARFDGKKPHYEYWFGNAVQKTMPTWLHSVLQGLMIELLRRAGYKAGSETRLNILPGWEPVPDVIGTLLSIEGRYPTEPVDVVIEILSPDDSFSLVTQKCRLYAKSGIPAILVLDPQEKLAWNWNTGLSALKLVERCELPNGSGIQTEEIWRELEARR